MIQTSPYALNSATKIFKNMLATGWKIISVKKEKVTKVFVVLQKLIFGKSEEKVIVVGQWALPRKEKRPQRIQQRQERRGNSKVARMAYC